MCWGSSENESDKTVGKETIKKHETLDLREIADAISIAMESNELGLQ